MLNYFRSKKTLNRYIDELENKCAVLSGKLRGIESINDSLFKDYQDIKEINKNLNSENARLRELTNYSNSQDLKIQELQKEKELLISKNHKLSGDLGKAFSDICDLQGKIKQLEAEKLGLLNKITNDDKFHDPDLKIDLTKPIRWKVDKKQRYVEFFCGYGYNVKDAEGGGLPFKVTTEYINENYENYEPDTKEISNIVPEVNKLVWVNDGEDMIKLAIERPYTIIDLTKKSYAVKEFFKKNLRTDNDDGTNSNIWGKDNYILKPLNLFNFQEWNISRDNIERIVNKWRKDGLVYKRDGFYQAAKSLKIILEKENGTA